MEPNRASRTSLQEVLDAIASAELTPTRKRDMASAVRTIAKALGREPRDILADPRQLGIRLKQVSPEAIGMNPARWHNVRSLLRKALGLVGPVMTGSNHAPLHPSWATLIADLKDKRSQKIRLSRLLHWLSERGISPEAVTWTDLDLFRKEILEDALLGDPQKTWTSIRRTWNLVMTTVPGWPQVPFPEKSRKETYILPWSDFPSTLKADVDRWLDRLACKDLGAEEGPSRPARPRTLKTREYQLRSFATALTLRAVDIQTLTSLSACLTLENFSKGLEFFYVRKGGKSSTAIHGLGSMLKGVAKHHCKVDEETVRKMAVLVKRLAVNQSGLTEKNRNRLRMLNDPSVMRKLLELPFTLQGVADDETVPHGRRRATAQTALAIEILLFAPIRAGNLVTLQLHTHLQKVGKDYHIVIPGDGVKNSADLEFVLSGKSVELIDWYLESHRKADPDELCLFPGKAGAKSQGATAYHIISSVKRYVGVDVNMHLFRHIAAQNCLEAFPGHYETVRRLLGHKKMETTTNFYTGLETIKSAQQFAKVITERRAAKLGVSR